MTAIIKRPMQPAFRREIDNTLEALQELVGGYIETVNLPGSIVMIVNEEGKILRLPINFHLNCDLIHGTAVFVSVNGEDFCSLSQAQENAVWRAMSYVI